MVEMMEALMVGELVVLKVGSMVAWKVFQMAVSLAELMELNSVEK
jgi:hypothetical protein